MKCLCGEEMQVVLKGKEGKIAGCSECLRIAVVADDFTMWYMLEKVEGTNEEVKRGVGAYEKGRRDEREEQREREATGVVDTPG